MISLKRLKDIEYIQQKQRALIIARRTATEAEQKTINFELNIIYDAKYKLLKGEPNRMENKEQIFYIYFTDAPSQPLKVRAENQSQARAKGNQYRKAWQIDGSIYKITKGE